MLGFGIALADNQPSLIEDVFAVCGERRVDGSGNAGQNSLLLGHGYTLEDAVVTTVDRFALVARQNAILGNFHIINEQITGDAVDSF